MIMALASSTEDVILEDSGRDGLLIELAAPAAPARTPVPACSKGE
jgi:hypothetical protein